MNERFHELGMGNLRKSYGHGMINDLDTPKTEIELILYAVCEILGFKLEFKYGKIHIIKNT